MRGLADKLGTRQKALDEAIAGEANRGIALAIIYLADVIRKMSQ